MKDVIRAFVADCAAPPFQDQSWLKLSWACFWSSWSLSFPFPVFQFIRCAANLFLRLVAHAFVQILLVNCEPWSELMIYGYPCLLIASSTVCMHHSDVMLLLLLRFRRIAENNKWGEGRIGMQCQFNSILQIHSFCKWGNWLDCWMSISSGTCSWDYGRWISMDITDHIDKQKIEQSSF